MRAYLSEFLGARTVRRNNNIFERVDTTTLKSDAERVRVGSSLRRKEFVSDLDFVSVAFERRTTRKGSRNGVGMYLVSLIDDYFRIFLGVEKRV